MSQGDSTRPADGAEEDAENGSAAEEQAASGTDRPSGSASAEDHTGVDAQEPIDPESPMLQSGGG